MRAEPELMVYRPHVVVPQAAILLSAREAARSKPTPPLQGFSHGEERASPIRAQ